MDFKFVTFSEYDDTWINRKSWFNRYGRKTGFICYLLRYFLQLNWRRNLHLTDNEYLALAAMVFGRPDAHFFQRLAIRPTPRCVTIGNWFQVCCSVFLVSLVRETDSTGPGRIAQSVVHLTRKSGVLGSIPSLATYFHFSFRFFKKGSCQLLAKVCARSTG